MGKGKEQKKETPGSVALTRMNYLYQAAYLTSKLSLNSSLSLYYGKIMKEISKKTVEKIHPDLKRTMCVACNNSLIAKNYHINVKIKPHNKKKKKQADMKTSPNINAIKNKQVFKSCSSSDIHNKYTKSRLEMRSKRPNKIWLSCSRCGFSKWYLQHPKYKLWIHKLKEFSDGLTNVART